MLFPDRAPVSKHEGYSAHAIFDLPDSEFQRQLRENARSNPNGWAVLPGMYGALLNGAGVSSVNHALIAPQLTFFRHVFPDPPEDQLKHTFNRYAHIVPQEGIDPHSPSPDVALVPIEPFMAPLDLPFHHRK
jgi:hypothetical protein